MFFYRNVEEIQFAETPTQERSLLGSSALLQCIATGQPKPEVSWRFKRQRVIPGTSCRAFIRHVTVIPPKIDFNSRNIIF